VGVGNKDEENRFEESFDWIGDGVNHKCDADAFGIWAGYEW
jgi:hypothetical protein